MKNVALSYFKTLEANESATRSPLQPSSKLNLNRHNEDLDKLANEISPGKNGLIRTKYQSPSATISSFKTDFSSSPSWMNRLSSKTPKLSPSKPNTNRNDSQSPIGKGKGNQGYEYLCRIQAIKNWLEKVLEETIPQSAVELIEHIRYGIYLAKLSNLILPTTRKVFTNDTKLQFKHTENINRFFELLDYMNVPDLFRFELTDLYDAKNVPKVWFCLHAMSYTIAKSNPDLPCMENLVDKIEFSPSDINIANKALLKAPLPNFASAQGGDRLISPTKSTPRKIDLKRDVPVNDLVSNLNSPSKLTHQDQSNQDPFIDVNSSVAFAESQPITKYSIPEPEKVEVAIEEPKPEIKEPEIKEPEMPVLPQIDVPTDINSQSHNVIKLQALIRGSNYRYQMFVDRIMLRSFADEITALISIIRGNNVRQSTIHRHRHDLIFFKEEIIQLQSAARRKLLNKVQISSNEIPSVIYFQSVIRAQKQRQIYHSIKNTLKHNEEKIISLQSRIRQNKVCNKLKPILDNKDIIEPIIIKFQAESRRFLSIRARNTSQLKKYTPNITNLQSLIRGVIARESFFKYKFNLERLKHSIIEFQSISRGAISRTKLCNSVLITLIDEDSAFNELFAKVRGNILRADIKRKKNHIKSFENKAIIPIQSRFRGIMVRFERELILEDLFENIDYLIDLQACVRGHILRKKINHVQQYYKSRVDQVIKCQAIIRSNYDQRAYRSLINMKNPPLSTIQRFAFLLTDNDIDFEEETMLAEARDAIIEKTKVNEDLEQQIENLDIKLSLLDRNKISVEEFLHHKKYNTYKPEGDFLSNSQIALSKQSRKKLEFLQSIFYLLQTNPVYFIRLYKNMPGQESFIFQLASQLFPVKDSSIDYHSREEYFLVRFIVAIMKEDIKSCEVVSDLTKSKKVQWLQLFLKFNNHTYQRQHLKLLFGRIVSNIVDGDEIDFESDPSIIHTNLREHEIKVHGRSDRQATISPQAAIKDEIVSTKFVENLMALREIASDTVDLISKNIHRIPLHVRVIAKNGYDLSKIQFPEKAESSHLAVAGVILVKHYIAPILLFPDNFGIQIDHSGKNHVSPRARKTMDNLRHLSRVLLQCFSLKPFSDNFMKPLNEFLSANADLTAHIIQQVINVQNIEIEYDMNQYEDVIARDKPRLTLKVSEMLDLIKIIKENLDIIAPANDDQLRDISLRMNDLSDHASDFVALAEMGQITLQLNPITQEESTQDSKTRLLFAQAKRALLYIIRVQDGPGLLELLISGIRAEHETKFHDIINQEQEEIRGLKPEQRPYNTTSLGDLTKLSYRDLKKMALEIILKLESQGKLTRKNSYQDLLNDIALDIKTKHSRRLTRKSQLDITMASNRKLQQKQNLLKKQLKDYNQHVESILSELQSQPKDRKIFNIIPVFSKQYFYHRELRKSNRLPKFGSYKYSAKKLIDQGIIKDLSSKYSSSSKLDFMFSCHVAGKFSIEAASGSVTIPGAVNTITLDQLLNFQYENKKTFDLFDGVVSFDTENLVSFIFRKFYDVKRE